MFALVKFFILIVMPQSPVRKSKGLFQSPVKAQSRRGGHLINGQANHMDEPEDVIPQFAPVSAFDLTEEDLGNCPDAANDDTSDEESGNNDYERLPGLRKNKYVDIEAEESGGEGGGEEEHEWDQYIEIYTVLDTQPLSFYHYSWVVNLILLTSDRNGQMRTCTSQCFVP